MKHQLVVELYYSGAWHDLTAGGEVLASVVVSPKRSGAMLTSKFTPGTTKMALVNTDGKYNPENPLSPLYGSLALNMPIRLSADGLVIWTGVAAEWRPNRMLGDIRRTELTGGGILRRLGIGLSPILSALTSAVLATAVMAYWPLTDDVGSDLGADAISGQVGFVVTPGMIKMSSVDGPDGDRAKLPELVSAVTASAPALTVTPGSSTGDSWTLDLGIRARRTGTFSLITPLVLHSVNATWTLSTSWSDTGGPSMYFSGIQDIGSGSLALYTTAIDLFDEAWHQIRLTLDQAGATITASLTIDGSVISTDTGTWTPGAVRSITILSQTTTYAASASIGHLALAAGSGTASTWSAFRGFPGELAHARFARLCTEHGIGYVLYGPVDDPGRPMGPQVSGKLLDVLYDCVTTDGGIAYESATNNYLVLKTLGGLYRQAPVLVVDINTDIMPPLDQLIGDRVIRNDVTAKRPSGSSARYEVTSGPYSVSDPPTGVGRYDTRVDANPSTDGALYQYAAWVASHGTIPGVQYAQVVLDLDANPALDTSPLDIGAVIHLTGIPAYDDPEDPRLMITSIEHKIGTHRKTITLGVVSARGWDVGELDTSGYLDCGGSTIAEALDTTETGVDLLITDACVWTHSSGDYDVLIGGERMTVTAVSAAAGAPGAYTQTMTVVRSVNTVVKSHASGAGVHVTDPVILAL